MKSFIKLLLILLMSYTCVFAQEYRWSDEPSESDPDVQWFLKKLEPYEAYGLDLRSWEPIKELQPFLKDKETVKRLHRLARRMAEHDVKNQERPSKRTWDVVTMLMWTQTDEAIDTIALFLKLPEPADQGIAVRALGGMQNPKVIPHLIAALRDTESRLPSTPDLIPNPNTVEARIEVNDLLGLLGTITVALATFDTSEASAALEVSSAQLKKKYGASEIGDKLLKGLQKCKERGVQYRKEGRVREVYEKNSVKDP